MANEKILVVDDDTNICELLRLYLTKEGYQVTTANDGEEGLEKFNQLKPDMVLLDVMMPRMDGLEVCRRIRKLGNTPVMMLTANIGYPIAEKERIAKPELCGGALLDIGVYPINFARMLFGSEITGITSACVKGETGVDLQSSITFVYRNHRMAVLQMTAFCANDRQGVISGDKGYIIVDNINNPQLAVVYSVNHEEVARYTCPPQITGFEYQVQASIDAIREGKIETPCMPHAETLHIMQMLDLSLIHI